MPYTKDYHLSPLGQRGGLATYPVAGVSSGAQLAINTATTVNGVDNGDSSLAAVTIGAGTVRFDGYPVTFAQFNTTVSAGAGVDLTADDAVVDVYLSPVRAVPLFVGAAPDPAPFAEGAFAAQIVEFTDLVNDPYQVVQNIFVKENSIWRAVEAFNGDDYPISYGWNNMPYNGIDETSAPLVSATPEVPVFLASKLPPHTSRPLALFRQTASIKVGQVSYSGGVATLTQGIGNEYLLPI